MATAELANPEVDPDGADKTFSVEVVGPAAAKDVAEAVGAVSEFCCPEPDGRIIGVSCSSLF